MTEGNAVSPFKKFEQTAVAALASRHLPASVVETVLVEAKRNVCNTPLLIGRADGFECGFVVFLVDGELTLECHGWGETLPDDFRTRDVRIQETA